MPNMSTGEIKAVRWVEWILAPLLVISVVSLGQCTASAQDELILLQADMAAIDAANSDTKRALMLLGKKQDELLRSQHHLEKAAIETSTHQQYLKKQLDVIQARSLEMLKILKEP